MGMVKPEDVVDRGVYGCFDGDKLLYVGSSYCSLRGLEYNHRNWYKKYGERGRTHFRSMLVDEGRKWSFAWLVLPYKCKQREIETQERNLINLLKSPLNKDLDPVRSSVYYGRYEEEVV